MRVPTMQGGAFLVPVAGRCRFMLKDKVLCDWSLPLIA